MSVQKYFVGSLLLFSCFCKAGEIAITFDDAPMSDGEIFSGEKRTLTLIAALKNANVPDTLFFCNSRKLNSRGRQRLQAYVDAGFHLANHSHSHRSANKLSVDEYIADIQKSDQALKNYDGFLPYHRFPFLHHGKDKKSIEELQRRLVKLGYKDGYVTVDNFDFYINHLLQEAYRNKNNIDMHEAEKFYVETLWQSIEFYDALALKYLGRSPKHVLLLHENDAAALFLPALIKEIRSNGWKVISPQEAYNDPIARDYPKGVYLNQGRVAALAYDAGAEMSSLKQERENTEVLRKIFESRVVTSKKVVE